MRDLGRLTDQRYNLLVIGGGIHGLFAAWDAARRGLSVALIDRGDYGSGLSFNHQRTVHGGLRALESFQFGKASEQLAERRQWALMAPALIRPLPFLVPIRTGEKPSKFVLTAGLRIYDALGAHRNDGLLASHHLPACRVLGAAEARARCPELPEAGLKGAALWHDYQTTFPDRLNWLVALAARQAGAVLMNYVTPTGLHRSGGRVSGVQVFDALTARRGDVWAESILIAAGSGLGDLLTLLELDDEPPPLVAVANVLVDRPAVDCAIAARGPSGRRLTAVPWAGRTLVGTFQSSTAVTPKQPFPIDVDAMLAEINLTFPWLAVRPPDVRVIHRGLVPADVNGRSVELLAEPRVIRHSLRGVRGIASLVGVKFTTARLAAARALDALLDEAGHPAAHVDTGAPVLPHASIGELPPDVRARGVDLGLDAEVLQHLGAWYGTEAESVLAYAAKTGLTERVIASSPVIAAEIGYSHESADAVVVEDAVYRRTWLGRDGTLEPAALERAAGLAKFRKARV